MYIMIVIMVIKLYTLNVYLKFVNFIVVNYTSVKLILGKWRLHTFPLGQSKDTFFQSNRSLLFPVLPKSEKSASEVVLF